MRYPRVVALLLVSLLAIASSASARPYFDTVFKDPKHPKISASVLYTADGKFDGGMTNVAVVYHKADPDNSLLPRKIRDLGVEPISWTLLELGGGGNQENAFGAGGTSIDVAPALLGPIKKVLERAGGRAAKFAPLLVSSNGSGVKLGISWKADIIKHGRFQRFNDLSFPPRYTVGYTYQF